MPAPYWTMIMQDYIEDTDDAPKSKTQVKNEMLALQALGVKLCELNPGQLAKIPLEDPLLKAVQEASRIKSHSARKRHFQFIGRLMREADHEAIESAYQALMQVSEQHVQQHHKTEQWRDRLLQEGDAALNEFVDQFPYADRQQLRQLLRTAKQEAERDKPPAAARKLFKLLRQTLTTL
ncbi:hypothetical protein M5M_17530 [Simiduia agarivorans SA1 = DSM 21679]|uniref:Dual-action ribosomal maturation protein DarP n=2 Tax=Simiduia TaxID=447467 RepID=K4KN77_SIMAS|nr:hypothetical protein M5M_17530 [Simiduia agarivorans SA1 = DSM 21679]